MISRKSGGHFPVLGWFSLWVYVAFHSQSTQNKKFAMSLQYLKENVKDEIDFLPVDTHQRFFKLTL